jgi:hypothetical protein
MLRPANQEPNVSAHALPQLFPHHVTARCGVIPVPSWPLPSAAAGAARRVAVACGTCLGIRIHMLTRRLDDTCLPNLIKAQLLNLDRFGYLISRIIESCTVSFFIELSVFIPNR